MGYKLAGFEVIGCNEIDPKMMEAYKVNHNPKYSYLEPIQTFKLRKDSPKELYNLDILDFDTEQGTYYAQRSFRGVIDMVGATYENYLPFGLKGLTDDERVLFIDAVINDPRYKGKIGLICIDGIADLCTNTNDIEKSKEVSQKIMQWNEGCHIIAVIHKTFDKDRATGHLGSFIQKKAETTIFLKIMDKEVKNSPVEVKQYDSRGAPFDTFYFDLDLNTVTPKECENDNNLTL